jgi:hypothetical protein
VKNACKGKSLIQRPGLKVIGGRINLGFSKCAFISMEIIETNNCRTDDTWKLVNADYHIVKKLTNVLN